MRICKRYSFFVGTKVQFDKLPEIVEKYLGKLGLSYKSFLFYFEELDMTDQHRRMLENYDEILKAGRDPGGFLYAEAKNYLAKTRGCIKAQTEHPELGSVREYSERGFDHLYLSNLDSPSAQARDTVYPIMSKVYRRYGFSETVIAYHGVDFFGAECPSGVIQENGVYKGMTGPGIVLERDRAFPKDTLITVRLDITDIADDEAIVRYRDEMIALLFPKVRVEEYTYCVLSDEEQSRYRELEERAKTVAKAVGEKIRQYISDRVPFLDSVPGDDAISLAPALKKAAKEYGYNYLKPYYHFYEVVKATRRSHILRVEMETGHYANECNAHLNLVGAGFDIWIASLSFAPSDPDEVKTAVFTFFEALKSIENDALDELDAVFPESPARYLSSVISKPAH